jgi:hypothetical protein
LCKEVGREIEGVECVGESNEARLRDGVEGVVSQAKMLQEAPFGRRENSKWVSRTATSVMMSPRV